MNVIVTGATSFIGRAVTEELLRQGCQVTAVIRPDSPGLSSYSDRPGIRVVPLNLSEISKLAKQDSAAPSLGVPEPPYAWFHLGWEGAGSANRSKPELQRKNIGYALDALEAAASLGCRRFLFSGSQAEYGICSGPMKEEMDCHPVSEYGKNKVEVLRRALARAEELGVEYLHARIFSVYGPGDHPWSLVETCLDQFLAGGHMDLGPCTQMWNYLYVEDAARALVQLLLGKAPGGVYNVAGEDTRPLRSFIEEIHQLCGGRGTYVYGHRPPNAEGVVSLNPDLSKLKAATGWKGQVDFAAGIKEMIRLRKEKDLEYTYKKESSP